ncbi:MAG: hypothetical protein U9N12_00715 [Euryarchaeota archaeon]|nr:hypothetical protein [Euryarchaeota archaeon]
MSVERFEDRNLIVLWAHRGQNRPHKVPRSVTGRKKDYHRYASTVEARADDERELISPTTRVPSDNRFNQTAGTTDLSPHFKIKGMPPTRRVLILCATHVFATLRSCFSI